MGRDRGSDRCRSESARLRDGAILKPIKEILAVIGDNAEEGRESTVSGRNGNNWQTLMIQCYGDDSEAAELKIIRDLAQEMADKVGHDLRLVKFTRVEVVETFTPAPQVTVTCPVCLEKSPPNRCLTGAKVGSGVDISICFKCRSVCKYSADQTALILMTDDEIAELPEKDRADINRVRAVLRRISPE
jgi:hypothetical protein